MAREGQTSGVTIGGGTTLAQTVASGDQRGTISAFNLNWDADWVVKAQITDRGWEAEMAIPLKTLRYAPGLDRTWGFNVLRNIRHKNEQVFLSPIPRGFDIYRISEAAKITGVSVPARRDVKVIPYGLASVAKDFTRTSDQVDGKGTGGLDLKWGIRPSLTLDATVNTDFAQVEADEQQLNLTRFDLFFPEKRPFFLENASTFQFGQPQAVDLFFSRRIGLSSSFTPIDIIAGTRLSGKVVARMGRRVPEYPDGSTGRRRRRAVGAGHELQRHARAEGNGTVDLRRHLRRPVRHRRQPGWPDTSGTARTASMRTFRSRGPSGCRPFSPGAIRPARPAATTRAARSTPSRTTSGRSPAGFRRWATGSIRRSVFCRGADTVGRRCGSTTSTSRSRSRGFAVFHLTRPGAVFSGFDGTLQSSVLHIHPFEIQPARGGRFGWFMDRNQDRPTQAVHGLRPRRPQGRHSTGLLHLVAERGRIPAQPQRARESSTAGCDSGITTTATSPRSSSRTSTGPTPA